VRDTNAKKPKETNLLRLTSETIVDVATPRR
jgi:hypothetical protein